MNAEAIVLAIVIALAGFSAGWETNGWRLDSQHQKAMADAERTSNQRLIALVKEHDAKADRLAAIDRESIAKLGKAKHETKRLRSCIAAGTCGLRIAATCPANTTGRAEAAQGSGVDSGTRATLAPAAGRAYSALREGINSTEGKLTACQKMLAEFSP